SCITKRRAVIGHKRKTIKNTSPSLLFNYLRRYGFSSMRKDGRAKIKACDEYVYLGKTLVQ
ncbi:hypothetical protein L9F63_003634, partial [Diploptera punctata]